MTDSRLDRRDAVSARRGGRCLAALAGGAVSASLRLRCDARSEGALQNSLRSLRSIRSDSCRESVNEAREYARRPRPCASRRPTSQRCETPPAAQSTALALIRTPHPSSAKVGAGRVRRAVWGGEERKALGPRAYPRASSTDSRQLFERSERSERSEFCRGAKSLSTAAESTRQRRPPQSARRSLPAPAFARAHLRVQRP